MNSTKQTQKEFLDDMQDAIDRVVEGPVKELDELLNESSSYISNIENINTELLKALEGALRFASNYWDIECAPLWVEQAIEARRKAKE